MKDDPLRGVYGIGELQRKLEEMKAEARDNMDYSEREQQARAYMAQARALVMATPPPEGQKFPPGARVRIADDLGSAMSHYPRGREATVCYTYAHAYGGDDVKSYCLIVDGQGQTSWYRENQLTLIDDPLDAEFIG